MKSVRLTVLVPKPLHAKFAEFCKADGRTMTWYLLRYINELAGGVVGNRQQSKRRSKVRGKGKSTRKKAEAES